MPSRLIAIGDIHGCFDSLYRLIEVEIQPQKADKLIFLGDYIDRGTQNKEVLDYIFSLLKEGYDIVTLKGNHEDMLLNANKSKLNTFNWLYNGGTETLWSFDIHHLAQLPKKYMDFFNNLPLYFSYKQFLFVHAGFNNNITDPLCDTYQMLWSRTDEYSHPFFNDKRIIHGHTPITLEECKQLIQSNSKFLNVDTGCVFKNYMGMGYLSAVDVLSNTIYWG
jgi:serine/threonine protein phosphatase 1